MKAAAIALLWCAGQLAAQGTGVVYGTVRDTTGRPVPSARVLIVGQPLPAVADARGSYRLTGVPAGAAVVRAGAIGYDPARREIDLRAGDSVEVDFVLTPHGIETHDYLELPGVIVTAAKRSQLIEDAVTSVAVVSEQDLAARAVNTVDEAIDRAAGVQLLNGQINIRGSTGYVQGLGARVLLLVDGVPMNQGDRGGINWDIVPVDQLQRVEIVKGAGSALYGSAAFGGVVNLITREIPTGFHARLRTTAGAYANPPYPEWRFRTETGVQGGGDVTASYGRGTFRGGVAAGARHADGYREQDARDHWQVAGRGAWAFADATELKVSGTWSLDDYEVPLAWCTTGFCDDQGQAYQPFKIDTRERGAHTASYKGYLTATLARGPSDRLRWQARASWLRTRFTDRRQSATEFSIANRLGAEARGEFRRGDGGVVTVGAEVTRADVESDFFGAHSQGEYAAYGQSEQPLGHLRTTTGVRVDYLTVDDGGLRAVLSPRVGAVLPTRSGAWRVSAGRGFRAPSIAERYANIPELGFGFAVVPNPLLDPETSWSFELGHARSLASRLRLDAAAFWTEAARLIEPAVVPGGGGLEIQFRNVSRARLVGLDLTAAVSPLPRVVASLTYQLLHARELAHDSVAERPLAFRPTHLATLSLEYAPPFMTLGADVRYTSRFDRVEIYPDDPRVASTVLDLRASYRRGPLALSLLAANALNYIYNLVPRTLAPVRTITLTATWAY